jgi:hypothetical protein
MRTVKDSREIKLLNRNSTTIVVINRADNSVTVTPTTAAIPAINAMFKHYGIKAHMRLSRGKPAITRGDQGATFEPNSAATFVLDSSEADFVK